jgi:hypothetical protein
MKDISSGFGDVSREKTREREEWRRFRRRDRKGGRMGGRDSLGRGKGEEGVKKGSLIRFLVALRFAVDFRRERRLSLRVHSGEAVSEE